VVSILVLIGGRIFVVDFVVAAVSTLLVEVDFGDGNCVVDVGVSGLLIIPADGDFNFVFTEIFCDFEDVARVFCCCPVWVPFIVFPDLGRREGKRETVVVDDIIIIIGIKKSLKRKAKHKNFFFF